MRAAERAACHARNPIGQADNLKTPRLQAVGDDIKRLFGRHDDGAVVGHGTFDELARDSRHFRALLEQWRLDRAITPPSAGRGQP